MGLNYLYFYAHTESNMSLHYKPFAIKLICRHDNIIGDNIKDLISIYNYRNDSIVHHNVSKYALKF